MLSAVLCRCQEWDGIVLFGEQELEWLRKHGAFDNGIPSKDTLRRFFASLDPERFRECFAQWIAPLRNSKLNEVIAIDGKTIRGTSTKSDPKSVAPHILTALASEQGLCLGQVKTDAKSNEITAIPELLEAISIGGCTVTIDAMGRQKEIVRAIRDKNADYIIAAKGNQGSLLEAIEDTVLLERPVETAIEDDCGHGRVEKRTCHLYTDLSHFKDSGSWKDLGSFIKIEKRAYHKATGKTDQETRYYISNITKDAAGLNKMVRPHWSVENQLHWVLDVVFGEDYARKRTGPSAENFNLVLKMALLLVNSEKSHKKSKNNKRLRALMDREYRGKLLHF